MHSHMQSGFYSHYTYYMVNYNWVMGLHLMSKAILIVGVSMILLLYSIKYWCIKYVSKVWINQGNLMINYLSSLVIFWSKVNIGSNLYRNKWIWPLTLGVIWTWWHSMSIHWICYSWASLLTFYLHLNLYNNFRCVWVRPPPINVHSVILK